MPVAPIAAGDVVQVIIESQVLQQTMLNVLYYRAKAGVPGTEYFIILDELNTAIAESQNAGIVPYMIPMMGPNAEVVRIQSQRVYPTRDLYLRTPVGVVGTQNDDCDASNLAAVIVKRGERTGRGKSGTFHLGGLPMTSYALGRMTAGSRTLLTALADKLNDPQLSAGGESLFVPGMFNPTMGAPNNFNEIVACDVQDTVRVMRRRTVGVGI